MLKRSSNFFSSSGGVTVKWEASMLQYGIDTAEFSRIDIL
jgi:hypothetical protein